MLIKYVYTMLFISLAILFILYGAFHDLHNEKQFVATIQMDGLGFYRLTNYMVDKDECVTFVDGTGEEIRFCGAYKIKTKEEYYRESQFYIITH